MIFKNYLWFFPFCSFALGYFFIYYCVRTEKIETPHVIGKSIHEAILELTQANLNARIISEKDDFDLPAGTIISQRPAAKQYLKPYQSIFLVTTRKPNHFFAPPCLLQEKTEIEKKLLNQGIRPQFYSLASNYPLNTCIGQFPLENEPLENKNMVIYIADEYNHPIIWPDFRNHTYKEIKDFLESHTITARITTNTMRNESEIPDDARIINQHPKPGSLCVVTSKQKPYIQFHIDT